MGDVGQNQVLFLTCVIQNAAEVNLWRQDLQVRETDFSLQLDDVLVWMAFVGNDEFAIDVVTHSVLLHARIKFNVD